MPDEYEVEAVGDAGNETAVILRVVDEGRSRGAFFDAELEFSHDELEGSMDFDGATVEVDFERF